MSTHPCCCKQSSPLAFSTYAIYHFLTIEKKSNNSPHQTGLTARVLSSTTTIESATTQLLNYIRRYAPTPRVSLLAGNSIHADRAFLTRQFPSIIEHLNYRILDVSTVKEAVRMWCSDEILQGVPRKTGTHEARMDILESIEEMKYYKGVLFDGK